MCSCPSATPPCGGIPAGAKIYPGKKSAQITVRPKKTTSKTDTTSLLPQKSIWCLDCFPSQYSSKAIGECSQLTWLPQQIWQRFQAELLTSLFRTAIFKLLTPFRSCLVSSEKTSKPILSRGVCESGASQPLRTWQLPCPTGDSSGMTAAPYNTVASSTWRHSDPEYPALHSTAEHPWQ